MANILLVEDDKSFGYVLSEYIKIKDFQVSWVETADAAFNLLSSQRFDLAILDINLKFSTGYEIAEILHKEHSKIPFIFLTARDLKVDQLKGYQLGAAEFITKPIDEEILIAKVQAILSRQKNHTNAGVQIKWKDLNLNPHKRELNINGINHSLTEKECLLLTALISKPEELILRKNLLDEIWENDDEFSRNSMDVYISRLRKYLQKSNTQIRNIHGKGFILE